MRGFDSVICNNAEEVLKMAKPVQKHHEPSEEDKEVLARWDEFLKVAPKNPLEEPIVLKFWNVSKGKRVAIRNAVPGIPEYCPSLSLNNRKIEIRFHKTEMPYDNLVVWEAVGLSEKDTKIIRHYLQERSNLFFFSLSCVGILSPYVRSFLGKQRKELRVQKGDGPKVNEG